MTKAERGTRKHSLTFVRGRSCHLSKRRPFSLHLEGHINILLFLEHPFKSVFFSSLIYGIPVEYNAKESSHWASLCFDTPAPEIYLELCWGTFYLNHLSVGRGNRTTGIHINNLRGRPQKEKDSIFADAHFYFEKPWRFLLWNRSPLALLLHAQQIEGKYARTKQNKKPGAFLLHIT